MKMGILWDYKNCYGNNDYDNRSLSTSGLYPTFSLRPGLDSSMFVL
jgi:hypothetical protein